MGMSGGGSSPPANTTSSTTTNPWVGAIPYLNGKKQGKTVGSGIFPESRSFYDQFHTLNPAQQSLNAGYQNTLQGRSTGQFNQVGNEFLNGAYDSTGNVNLNSARASQGALNPTQAYQRMLSGKIDNPYLQGIHQASINDSMRGYNDAIRQVQQQVMPGISNQSFADGMYGSSRQGIAQGMVGQEMARNARDLGIAAMDTGNELYGNAYQNAQGMMASAAGDLNAQAAQNAQYNAGLDLQQNAQNAAMAQTGLNTLTQGYGIQDNTFNQLQALLQAPQNQAQNALNQYASIVSPGAGMGGSSSSSTQVPIYGSNGAQIIGGGLGLAGLLSSLGGS
jgi:hypothetical protein